MKETVKRLCGHEEVVEVFGSAKERENKIKWYESTDCSQCFESANNNDCEKIEMKYSEYKNNYSNCKTKKDSYNKSEKTIIVYVPKKVEETVETVEKITVEEIAKVAESTIENVNEMVAKTNEELESQYETFKNKLTELNHPQKDELLIKIRTTIDMIYRFKQQ